MENVNTSLRCDVWKLPLVSELYLSPDDAIPCEWCVGDWGAPADARRDVCVHVDDEAVLYVLHSFRYSWN